ncbi:MAG TPA: hypothetical protein VJ991_00485 [Balneolales bacterium]|nr:hypothetical protein [Balneolales bacterium]
MKREVINRIYRKADADLARARKELYRPEEDVVLYTSCVSARSAMYRYLVCLSMLSRKKGDIDSIEKGKKPMNQLIKEAGKKYPEVAKMDFSAVHCKRKDIKNVLDNEETHFCNNTEMVNRCTNLANQLKEIVTERASKFVQP